MFDQFDIYFRDLKPEVQQQYLDALGLVSPEEGNFDFFPITSTPLGEPEVKPKKKISFER